MLAKKELYPLKGIVTVLNTPFTKEDRVDLEALKNNVLEALNAGVAGILVPAMAAEVYKLSYTERLSLLTAVLETVGDRVPVIGGAGEPDLYKSKELVKAYIDMGCKNILFQIPFVNEEQFNAHFMELAQLDPDMIMLQDWDANGYGLSDALICNLFEKVPAFKCLKIETVPAGPKYSRILELTHGKLNLSGGWAVTQMMEGLQRGVHAFMPTGMHFIYTAIYQYFEEGNIAEADALFKKIIPVLAFSNQHLDVSIHFFKRLLYRQGIYNTPNVRNPILPFDALHQKLADKHIDSILSLEKQIKAQKTKNS
ncbi:dihydrodipicolinate synthase family protein [Arenibacter aquaticus]|uniref:Dihydrodipicolinate synthase family protein n=1 Tax=Arenibacter aquaticus TaxID=2489054 RepID=A0A3S0B0F4_9FLAO|nr:dihydrodipicolinate synthase family protein [Arenibacter aquaticus]RTE54756.1 dihydrodipicolinate synthase family protein [Arenibacter aquaticus]